MSARITGLAFIMALWFVISFVTNILGPIMPLVIRDFGLSLGLAGFLPFSFFLAYGIVSVPAGLLVERWGAKRSLLFALAVDLVGAGVFALSPSFTTALAGLFVIGMGMAMLQVVINPLTRTVGGEANYPFYSVMGQFVFGAASFASPLAFQRVMSAADTVPRAAPFALVPAGLPWVLLYWLFALLFVAAIVLTAVVRLPRVELNADERVAGAAVYGALLRQPKVWGFFAAIAAYVATEQSLANWMSQFLQSYHGFSPLKEGAQAVAWFWGLMAVGCIIGLVLLKTMRSRDVLRLFVIAALGLLILALFAPGGVALWAFPALGLCLSVMFPIVFALGLNSFASHHGALAGIFCTGIVGGAVGPLLVGQIGDAFGLRTGLSLVAIPLVYLLAVAIRARPLVDNV